MIRYENVVRALHAFIVISSISVSSVTYSISLYTEVAIGELVDKITILQIKKERINDVKKLRNIIAELETLEATLSDVQKNLDLPAEQMGSLVFFTHELYEVNKKLWDIEDAIRDKELSQEFDDIFIQLARSVYITNDKRCEIKRAINNLLGSRLVEEKSYKKYIA